MRILKRSEVVFADNRLEKDFNELNANNEIKIYLKRAIKDIQENAFCGIQIPKKLIPNKVEILSLILDWFNHSEYERKFRY